MISYENMDELVVFKKQDIDRVFTKEELIESKHPLSKLIIEPTTRIEDLPNSAFIDFANMYIGGGSLSSAAVQEEILFAIFPEACVSMGLMDKMTETQAVSIENVLRVYNYKGYSSSFAVTDPVVMYFQVSICIPYRKSSNLQIIGIDALCDSFFQYTHEGILREVNKAYSGFKLCKEELENIASGKWGCGVFGGNPYLKSIIQWVSASIANKAVGLFN